MSPLEGAGAHTIARFGHWSQSAHALYQSVRELPVYAKHPLAASSNLEEFIRPLPFMGRQELRVHFPNGFLPPSVRFAQAVASKKIEVVRTSGTSSDRLQVLWADGWWQRQELEGLKSNPYIAQRLNESYREAVLTTPLCSENVCQTGPTPMSERCVDYLLFLNTQLDPSHWGDHDQARMLDEIEQFQPTSIDADPVYLASLARYIRRSGRRAPRFGWIILAYELVTALDKAEIQRTFDCPAFDFYGLTEAGVFFLECTAGRHHFCGSNSVVEILQPELGGWPLDMGEVVITTWCNSAQPLIRYKTGDLVRVDPSSCPCGRPGPTIRSFEGRIRDVLQTPDGGRVTPRQIDRALAHTAGLYHYRCVQKERSLIVDYVRDPGTDPGQAIQECLAGLGIGMRIDVRPVPFISPEQSGKYRTVVPE
jgi:phenylacetate-coenzyme A ligase PaaK-like adenylate-forming protein